MVEVLGRWFFFVRFRLFRVGFFVWGFGALFSFLLFFFGEGFGLYEIFRMFGDVRVVEVV